METQSSGPKLSFTYTALGDTSFFKKLNEAFDGFDESMERLGITAITEREADAAIGEFLLYPREWNIEKPMASLVRPPTFFQIVAILKEPFSKELVGCPSDS